MNIGIISDLHITHYNNTTRLTMASDIVKQSKDLDVLIIAGDLAPWYEADHFLLNFDQMDCKVLFVFGNHEYYGYDFAKQFKLPEYNNTRILNGNSCTIGDVAFFGFTGWIDGSWENIHDITPNHFRYKKRYNDFKLIKNYQRTMAKTKRDIHRLKTFLNRKTEKRVVISHFIPSRQLISYKYINNSFNPCFANEWDLIMSAYDIDYWIYGHKHDGSYDEMYGVKMICNSYGYPHENKGKVKIHKIVI